MKRLFEGTMFAVVSVIILAMSGLRLDYVAAAAYDVFSSTGMDGKPQITSTSMIVDQYGTQNYIAPNGEMVSVPLYKLVGDAFAGTVLDPVRWAVSTSASASAVVGSGALTMSTGTTASGVVSVQSQHIARFSGMAPNKAKITLQTPDVGTVGNTRRWGAFTTTDGAFFELSEVTFCAVTRISSVDTRVCNGLFNGSYGRSINYNTLLHQYEIVMQPRQVVFIQDGRVLHKVTASATAWTSTLHLPVRLENTNASGITSNVLMAARLGSIARFGIPQTQVAGFYQAGLTAGTQVKYGPGNIHYLTVSGVTSGSIITLYDGTSTAGSVIFSTGAMTLNAPLTIALGGEAFSNGLFLTITAANSNAKVTFD